jgi:hypothetical protein
MLIIPEPQFLTFIFGLELVGWREFDAKGGLTKILGHLAHGGGANTGYRGTLLTTTIYESIVSSRRYRIGCTVQILQSCPLQSQTARPLALP